MAERKYSSIGAGWDNEDGSISIKLKNGKWMNLFVNEYKKSPKSPSWNVTMKTEDADYHGLLVEEDDSWKQKNATAEEIDVEGLF